MLTVPGMVKNGTIALLENLDLKEGEQVTVTFPKRNARRYSHKLYAAWDQLTHAIDEATVDTGISDLAHQHDHYVHGTPKRDK